VEVIVALRRLRMTGAEIAFCLAMALSTVSAVLLRVGLGKRSRLEPLEPPNRYERRHAGELLHIDVKKLGRIPEGRAGHRVHGNRRLKHSPPRTDNAGVRRKTVGWEFVHVCVDDATRLAYVEAVADEKAVTAVGFLKRAIAFYRRHGITVKRVMTDNGSAYRSTIHAFACRLLGLRHLRTRPYRPGTNGKAERFIRTLRGLVMPTPEWTLAAAQHAVRRLVAKHGLERYPTPKEFADADRSGLFHAITTHFGGRKAFARRLVLPRARNEWTSETADAAVVSLVARLGDTRRYPTDREMRRYGPPGLESAARRFGGNRTRAARLGLFLRPRWDLDTAAAAVCELVERLSLGGYPTQRHFTDARASGLYRAIAKRLGGHQAMAARLGLQLSHPRRR
jgi:transposase InsO family protein